MVSLGSLISCGEGIKDRKDSGRNNAILQMWDEISIAKQKLLGPTEILALNFPEEWTNHASNIYLRDGWLSKSPNYQVALEVNGKLASHGGLTYGEWVALGRPSTAGEAAQKLNEKYARTLFQGPCFRLSGAANPSANPIWADAITELYPSWLYALENCPFDQIVGGESLNNERASNLKNNPDSPIAHLDEIVYTPYGSLATLRSFRIIAVDYDLGSEIQTTFRKDRSLYVEES